MTSAHTCPVCHARLSVVYRDPRTDELRCLACDRHWATVSYAEAREVAERERGEE